MKEDLQATIKKVGDKYKTAPKQLKITIGEILAGKIKLKIQEESNGRNN
ncbi:hypothetical protein [Haloimpatiens massiliensis]|nr:hypothetical protein [Haloimpatiens massiliensis]